MDQASDADYYGNRDYGGKDFSHQDLIQKGIHSDTPKYIATQILFDEQAKQYRGNDLPPYIPSQDTRTPPDLSGLWRFLGRVLVVLGALGASAATVYMGIDTWTRQVGYPLTSLGERLPLQTSKPFYAADSLADFSKHVNERFAGAYKAGAPVVGGLYRCQTELRAGASRLTCRGGDLAAFERMKPYALKPETYIQDFCQALMPRVGYRQVVFPVEQMRAEWRLDTERRDNETAGTCVMTNAGDVKTRFFTAKAVPVALILGGGLFVLVCIVWIAKAAWPGKKKAA